MITLQHVHYEIHSEVSKNDKVHNSVIKYFSHLNKMKLKLNLNLYSCIVKKLIISKQVTKSYHKFTVFLEFHLNENLKI